MKFAGQQAVPTPEATEEHALLPPSDRQLVAGIWRPFGAIRRRRANSPQANSCPYQPPLRAQWTIGCVLFCFVLCSAISLLNINCILLCGLRFYCLPFSVFSFQFSVFSFQFWVFRFCIACPRASYPHPPIPPHIKKLQRNQQMPQQQATTATTEVFFAIWLCRAVSCPDICQKTTTTKTTSRKKQSKATEKLVQRSPVPCLLSAVSCLQS